MSHNLSQPERFTITGPQGETYRGGNQEWYRDLWQRRAGCGPTTAATLLAAVATRLLGKIRFGGLPWLSALPPILFNAVAIGGEWCYAMTGSINGAFWVFAGQIALGQLPPCLLGVWLVGLLERRSLQTIIEGK